MYMNLSERNLWSFASVIIIVVIIALWFTISELTHQIDAAEAQIDKLSLDNSVLAEANSELSALLDKQRGKTESCSRQRESCTLVEKNLESCEFHLKAKESELRDYCYETQKIVNKILVLHERLEDIKVD